MRSGTSVRPFCCVLPIKLLDLLLVQQQAAPGKRLMVKRPAGQVLRDVAVHQPDVAAAHFGVGVAQIGLAVAQRFHLGARKDHARFHFFEKVIVVGSGAILGNDLLARRHLFYWFFLQVWPRRAILTGGYK